MKEKSDSEDLPMFISRKLNDQKLEYRIAANKQVTFGKWGTVSMRPTVPIPRLKVTIQSIVSASAVHVAATPVPPYGRLVSDLLQISVSDCQSESRKTTQQQCTRRSPCLVFWLRHMSQTEPTDSVYPLIYSDETSSWTIPTEFELTSDGVKLDEGDWRLVTIVKEPASELLALSISGGIMYSKMNKNFSLRVPKGNFKEDQLCKFQVVPVDRNSIQTEFQAVFERPLESLEQYSELTVLQLVDAHTRCPVPTRPLLGQVASLRRAVTVRLPLPTWMSELVAEASLDLGLDKALSPDQVRSNLGGLVLMVKASDGSWRQHESGLTFTESGVTLDTHHFGCFLFIRCKPNREMRLMENCSLLDALSLSRRVVLTSFIHVSHGGHLHLWLELLEPGQVRERRRELTELGCVFVQPHFPYSAVESAEEGSLLRRFRRKDKPIEEFRRQTFEVMEEAQLHIVVTGEFERKDDQDRRREMQTRQVAALEQLRIEKDMEEVDKGFGSLVEIGQKTRGREVSELDDIVRFDDAVDIEYRSNVPGSHSCVVPIVPVTQDHGWWQREVLHRLQIQSSAGLNSNTQNGHETDVSTSSISYDLDPQLLLADSDESTRYSTSLEVEKQRSFHCRVSFRMVSALAQSSIVPTQYTDIYVPVEVMKEHFKVLTEEDRTEIERKKKEATEIKKQKETMNLNASTKVVATKPQIRTVDYNRLNALSKPRFLNRVTVRQPKLMSRRSLTSLCSVLKQGLTLGVYLNLPDKVIAGIGFDSLSQLAMSPQNNVTYKVLLAWKSIIQVNKVSEKDYVEQLSSAVAALGHESLGQLILWCWQHNIELSSAECERAVFSQNYSLPSAN